MNENEEVRFLRGQFVKVWQGKSLSMYKEARDTLVAVDDIVRVKACKVFVYNVESHKNDGSENGIVVTCRGRRHSSDFNYENEEEDYYILHDDLSVIAKAIHREESELASMLLELEIKEK